MLPSCFPNIQHVHNYTCTVSCVHVLLYMPRIFGGDLSVSTSVPLSTTALEARFLKSSTTTKSVPVTLK